MVTEGSEQSNEPAEDPETQKFFEKMIKGIIALEKVFLALNVPLIMVIGKLLSNEWVYLDPVLSSTLQTLWIIVRNFVNIAFVVVLIYVAFLAVAGGGGDKNNYAIKAILPKVFIALILVNFSFLAGKLILDLGNLATTFSFSIVNDVGKSIITDGSNDSDEFKKKLFCWPTVKVAAEEEWWKDPQKYDCITKDFWLGVGYEQAAQVCSAVKKENYKGNYQMGYGFVGTEPPELTLFNAKNAMYVYAYNVFRLAEVEKVFDGKSPDLNFTNLSGILLNVITAIIMAGLLILLNIAMIIAFGVRMVMIWLLLIFSPVVALDFAIGGKIKAKFNIVKDFISLAFMPAIVGFVLSLGFIMYNVFVPQTYGTDEIKGFQTFSVGQFTVHLAGNMMPGMGNLFRMILSILMMIIIWKGVFMAMKSSSKIVEGAVGGVQKFGESVADIGKKSLSLIPIIPTGSGGMKSAASVARGIQQVPSMIDQKITQEGSQFIKESGLPQILNLVQLDPKTQQAIGKLKQENSNMTLRENRLAFRELWKKDGNTTNEQFAHESRELIEALLNKPEDKPLIERYIQNPDVGFESLRQRLQERHGADFALSEFPSHSSTGTTPPSTPTTPPAATPAAATISVTSKDTVRFEGRDIKIDNSLVTAMLNAPAGNAGAKKAAEDAVAAALQAQLTDEAKRKQFVTQLYSLESDSASLNKLTGTP